MKQVALLSVTNKTGIVDFGNRLRVRGFDIVSTGGTAKALRDAGVDVLDVSTYTGVPECFDGRLKTLHPKIFGGILFDSRIPEQVTSARALGFDQIDVVAVNLYDFDGAVAQGATYDGAIEKIDIGGPSLLRAAAKNSHRVFGIVDPAYYHKVINTLDCPTDQAAVLRHQLMVKIFEHTAEYDRKIARHFGCRTVQ